MSGVLTQSEIDELLNQLKLGSGADAAAGTQPEDAASYHAYDFRTANKFSKEQMRTLHVIFENFAYLLTTRLTVTLRTSCEVNILSLEEVRFGEFSNSISTPTVLAIIDAQPLRGQLLMELTPAVAYGIVSRLFGGAADALSLTKNFTEIELMMLENIMLQFLLLFDESWEKVLEVKASLQRMETSPQFAQIAAMNEPAAIITLNVKIDHVQDVITFCLPHFIIQPIAKKLNTTLWTLGGATRRETAPEQSHIIAQQLAQTAVTLRAQLNPMDVSFGELLHLKVGDVLCLNHRIDEYITVMLEKTPKFRGILGMRDKKQVVQIAQIIKESDSLEQRQHDSGRD